MHRASDADLKLEAYGARPTRSLGPSLARSKASEALKFEQMNNGRQKARQAGERRVNGRTLKFEQGEHSRRESSLSLPRSSDGEATVSESA